MPTMFTLKTRSRELRFKGFFKDASECLEAALRDGVDMTGLKLSGLNLARANLDGGVFTGADFSGCNLGGANMSECDLQSCVFSHASLTDVCLCESDLRKAVFFETSFSASDISGSIIEECLFSCPSAFTLKFSEAATFAKSVYYADAVHCPMGRPPIVITGLPYQIVVMDDHLMIGRTVRALDVWNNAGQGSVRREELAFYASYRDVIAAIRCAKSGEKQLQTASDYFA